MFNRKRNAASWQEDAALYAQWARAALSAGKLQQATSDQKLAAYYAQLARDEMNIAA